jgi:hypothetical protein
VCTGEVLDGSVTPYTLTLEFPKLTVEECDAAPTTGPTAGQVVVTKQVVLGSCGRAAGKETSPVTFEVAIPPTQAAMFGVDAPKGTVPPGGSQKVNGLPCLEVEWLPYTDLVPAFLCLVELQGDKAEIGVR